VSNAMVLINQKIIANLAGVARPMQKQTPCILKPKKVSYAYTHSNTPTVEAIIKRTLTYVHFEDTDLIESDTKRNMLRSMKTGPNQFIQL